MKTTIGFAIHDGARDGRAFQIEDDGSAQALVFGTHGNVPMKASGVPPRHCVPLPHEGMRLAAGSTAQAPAYVGDLPLGTEWTVLDVPCRVTAGAAVVEIFVVRAPLADLES